MHFGSWFVLWAWFPRLKLFYWPSPFDASRRELPREPLPTNRAKVPVQSSARTEPRLLPPATAIMSRGHIPNEIGDLPVHALPARQTWSDRATTWNVQQPSVELALKAAQAQQARSNRRSNRRWMKHEIICMYSGENTVKIGHTVRYIQIQLRYIRICTPFNPSGVHMCMYLYASLLIHTDMHSNTCWYSKDPYRYALPSWVHMCMYLHVFLLYIEDIHAYMHLIQLMWD